MNARCCVGHLCREIWMTGCDINSVASTMPIRRSGSHFGRRHMVVRLTDRLAS